MVVSGTIMFSMNSFATLQTSATSKILYALHYNSRICFELRSFATVYELTQWTSGASQTSSVLRCLRNKFKVLKNPILFNRVESTVSIENFTHQSPLLSSSKRKLSLAAEDSFPLTLLLFTIHSARTLSRTQAQCLLNPDSM